MNAQSDENDAARYAPGDRVWRWWDTGIFGSDPQPLTVIRVNRKTLTVRTDRGAEFRLPFADCEGHWTDDTDTRVTPPESRQR